MFGKRGTLCCGSITARHATTCDAFTPTGLHKLSELQRSMLRAAAVNSVEGYWVPHGRRHRPAARALERKDLVQYKLSRSGVGGLIFITAPGKLMLRMLGGEARA